MAEQVALGFVGIVVLGALWLVFGVWLGFEWPLRVADGADGRPSTSKFQFFLWTAVIVWGYAAVAARRSIDGTTPGDIGMPTNLFILMGLGAGTALAAKLVTVGRGGRPSLADPGMRTYRSLVADDGGNPALEKIQVLAWTLVAAGVFIVSVWQVLGSGSTPSSLPNVGDALLVLLRVGEFAYGGGEGLPDPSRSAPRRQWSAPPGQVADSTRPASCALGGTERARLALSLHAGLTAAGGTAFGRCRAP